MLFIDECMCGGKLYKRIGLKSKQCEKCNGRIDFNISDEYISIDVLEGVCDNCGYFIESSLSIRYFEDCCAIYMWAPRCKCDSRMSDYNRQDNIHNSLNGILNCFKILGNNGFMF